MTILVVIKLMIIMLERKDVILNSYGEIESANITTIKKVNADEFCQVYFKDNEEFYQLTKAESNVLSVCWAHSIYYEDPEYVLPGNKITYDGSFKELVLKKTGLKEGTVKNTMASLVKKEMLLKDEKFRGIYYLNPKFFFKGKIAERTKLITKTIKYQITLKNAISD